MLRRRLFRGRRGRFVRRPRVHAFRRRNPGPLLLVNPGKKRKAKVAKKKAVRKQKRKVKAKRKPYRSPGVTAQFEMAARQKFREFGKKLDEIEKGVKKPSRKKAKKEKAMAKRKKRSKGKSKKTTKRRAKRRAAPKKRKTRRSKRRKAAAVVVTRRPKGKTRRRGRRISWTGPYPHMKHRRVPKKYRRRGRGWWNTAPRHRKASKKGWGRRYKGKRGRRFYVTSKGRKYRRPTGKRGKRGVFKNWNPRYAIRTRNPMPIWDVAMPVLLGIGGFLGAAFLVGKIGPMLPAGIQKWAPAAIPVALGLAAMFLAPKYLPKFSKVAYGLGFGLLMAGGISLMNQVLPENIKSMIGLAPSTAAGAAAGNSGFVYRPGAGVGAYTLAPSMSGYVSRPGAGIGSGYNLSAPLESRYRRTLGANTMVAPGQRAPGGVPTQITTGYETVGMKPYGLGLPMESRRYNNYNWIGVYDKGVYE